MKALLPMGHFYGYVTANETRAAEALFAQLDHTPINLLIASSGVDSEVVRNEVTRQMQCVRRAAGYDALVDYHNRQPLPLKDRISHWLTDWLIRGK